MIRPCAGPTRSWRLQDDTRTRMALKICDVASGGTVLMLASSAPASVLMNSAPPLDPCAQDHGGRTKSIGAKHALRLHDDAERGSWRPFGPRGRHRGPIKHRREAAGAASYHGGVCAVGVADSRTRDLPSVCRRAGILVAPVGRPEMIRGDWIKPWKRCGEPSSRTGGPCSHTSPSAGQR